MREEAANIALQRICAMYVYLKQSSSYISWEKDLYGILNLLSLKDKTHAIKQNVHI
jgi:hypothetical protein